MNKLEKIESEIERLIRINQEYKKEWKWKFKWFSKVILGRLEVLEGLLSFIKHLENEPISKIWHNSDEQPEYSKVLLVIQNIGYFGEPGIPHLAKYDSFNNCFIAEERTDVDNNPLLYNEGCIEKWAYVDDLINPTATDAISQEQHKSDWLKELEAIPKEEVQKKMEEIRSLYPITEEEPLSEVSHTIPVSEDLDDAAIEICSNILKGETITVDGYEYVVLSDAEECFKAGSSWQKQQLMIGAVETTVKGYINGKGIYVESDIPIEINANEGDKVKLIIIKED